MILGHRWLAHATELHLEKLFRCIAPANPRCVYRPVPGVVACRDGVAADEKALSYD